MATGARRTAGINVLPLIVGVSSRALFALEEEHAAFVSEGEDAYGALQRERETIPLKAGCAFELIKHLLALNPPDGEKLVEVVLLSKNAPDLALRAFHSCECYGLPIAKGSFTSGRSVVQLIDAWGVDLFLSNDDGDVRAALATGTAAARLWPVPERAEDICPDEVHIALDGDSTIFSAESDEIFRDYGLEVFERHEKNNAQIPMAPGPLGGAFLQKLVQLRICTKKPDGSSRVRITLVTARSAPAHERVIRTLRHWNALFDEAHFVGDHEKARFLSATGAHIFFDDLEMHVSGTAQLVSAGLVPGKLS
jgi:5'-nucleotidase